MDTEHRRLILDSLRAGLIGFATCALYGPALLGCHRQEGHARYLERHYRYTGMPA